jgi:uncharacterized membrane protein
MARIKSGAVVCVCVTALVTGACDRSSSLPMEPQLQVQASSFTVDMKADGPAGTFTVTAATCACASKGFTVAIDGVVVGTVGCAEQRQFAVTASSYLVSLSSAGVPASVSITVRNQAPDTGTTWSIRCRS